MKIWGSANVLSKEEIELIEKRAFNILSKLGVRVDHPEIRKRLKRFGATGKENILYFPEKILEDFIHDSVKIDYDFSKEIECSAGAYPQFFLPPGEISPVLYDCKNMKNMMMLADYLDDIDVVYSSIGIPDDYNLRSFELFQKLLRWKYFKKVNSPVSNFKPYHDGPSLISSKEMVRYTLEFGYIMATEEGGSICDYIYGDVYINSPLYFDKKQAEIFWELYINKCHCDVGSVMTIGGSAPLIFSSAIPLQLAEIIFVNILQRVFYNIRVLNFASILAPLDMRKGIFQYGRPELSIAIVVMGQLARKYGALFNCCSYLCDAKLPSSEAGMQKTMSALSAVYAGSYGIGSAGLLSTDEIVSPEQLIIDAEFAGAIKRFAGDIEILDSEDEFEMIKKIGHGGNFIGELSTALNYKKNWEPFLFSKEKLSSWFNNKCKIDIDYAREIYLNFLKEHNKVYIGEKTEKKLLRLLKRVE
jgi:trimethylamine--corrinoid protein Co-methyltransferase